MKRTKLTDRVLPDYTRGEEQMNMITHIVGGAMGIAALTLCVIQAARAGNVYGIITSAIYGASMILMFTVSSVYHGLRPNMGKKVMQVIDHCTIYFLIAGTYTPILLSAIRIVSPSVAWTLFGVEWGLAAVATVFTAIDLKKYSVLSMICYIGLGWCVVFAAKTTIAAIQPVGLLLLLLGGIAYTIGAVLYGFGRKYRYMHSVFHLFVVVGSVLQFLCILFFVL